MELSSVKTLFLDGDGVLWHADTPAPRLVEFFEIVSSCGISWALLSNNASLSNDDFVAKFTRFGVEAADHNIINSTSVTIMYLKETYSNGSPIYVVGQKSLRDTISGAGFEVVDDYAEDTRTVAVVVGIDRDFNYRKLSASSRLVRAGAEFIATNTDSTYPTERGLEPGAGSIVSAIATASGRSPQVMGKPQPAIFNFALNQLGAERDSTWMVGDRLETDILGAHVSGLKSVLVLSGVTTKDDVSESDILPDLILDDIGALADALRIS